MTLHSFLFLNIFINNDILTFIVIMMFTGIDFWMVKNVSGRILVGLRYWSEIDEDGNEIWKYESCNDDKNIGYTDALVFWTGLYGAPAVWAFLGFMDLISFKFFWMYVCIICFTLSSTNVSGYYNCRREHYAKLRGEL